VTMAAMVTRSLQAGLVAAHRREQTGCEVGIVKRSPLPQSFALNPPSIQASLTLGVRPITARRSHTARLRTLPLTDLTAKLSFVGIS
jgi:hypothetical protein